MPTNLIHKGALLTHLNGLKEQGYGKIPPDELGEMALRAKQMPVGAEQDALRVQLLSELMVHSTFQTVFSRGKFFPATQSVSTSDSISELLKHTAEHLDRWNPQEHETDLITYVSSSSARKYRQWAGLVSGFSPIREKRVNSKGARYYALVGYKKDDFTVVSRDQAVEEYGSDDFLNPVEPTNAMDRFGFYGDNHGEALLHKDVADLVKRAMQCLQPKERVCIEQKFLQDTEGTELTLEQIGKSDQTIAVFGRPVSKQHVSICILDGIARMKSFIENDAVNCMATSRNYQASNWVEPQDIEMA